MIGLLQRRAARPAVLKAGRLRLVAMTPAMLIAEDGGNFNVLAQILRAKLTAEWPPADWEPHVCRLILTQYEEMPETLGWHRYVLLDDGLGRGRTLVGAVGGFPKAGGDVEIGYSTLPEFQRRGYATGAAGALVEWLLRREGVASVSAQAFARTPESIKVMERCGMRYVGDGDDAGTVRYRKNRG